MRTERFTKEEKLKAIDEFYKSLDDKVGNEREMVEVIKKRALFITPSSVTCDDCMYAEIYNADKSFVGTDKDGALLFYSIGDDVIFKLLVRNKSIGWLNGQVAVVQGYVNGLNESIYGRYHLEHLRGLTFSCFIPHHNVPVYKDSHYSIYAYNGGFGLQKFTAYRGQTISVCFGFVPYDYFKAEYISTVYRKIWHYLLKIIHTNLSGGFTDEADTVKMNMLCTECVNDKDVVQFVKEAFIIKGNEDDGFELEMNKDFFYNPELEEENEE
jgi:predicted nucleic-acid-binding Zn-ribbon protein